VLRREHFELMGDGAVLANAGHFDVEISLPDLAALAVGPPREVVAAGRRVRPRDGRRLHLSPRAASSTSQPPPAIPRGDGPVVRRAGARVVHLAARRRALEPGVPAVAASVDHEVARLKLASLGIEIDALSGEQERYLRPFGRIR
jgi:adenosylhomocysteinase